MKCFPLLLALTVLVAAFSAMNSTVTVNDAKISNAGNPDRFPLPDPESIVKVLNLSSYDKVSSWVSEAQGVKTWRFNISSIGCQSARVHLSSFRLQDKDRLAVYGLSRNMRVGEEIFEELEDTNGDVYSHRVWADELVLQLSALNPNSGFVIRYVHFADCMTSDSPVGDTPGICGSIDYKNAVCYEKEYPEPYRLASGVVKIRLVISGAAHVCSGFKISDSGRFLTNYHCMRTQAVVSSAEVLDHYDSTSCSSDTGSARRTLHGETLVWTSGSLIVDATIFTVEESEASQIPCLPLADFIPSVDQRINIIEHPSGLRKKIAIKSDQDAGGYCVIDSSCSSIDWCYKCDAPNGASGSPVFDYSSGNVVALHHGRPRNSNCPNVGVKISDVIDAARGHLDSCSQDPVVEAALRWPKNGRTYFFRGSQYWRINDSCICIDSGYPADIATYWPGVPDNLDAAVVWSANNRTFFFKGSQYWRFNDSAGRVDDGYPKAISYGWPGLPNDLDAGLLHTNGRTYFFKGDLYWRWSNTNSPDCGYPKSISSSSWPAIPTNVDAAVQWYNDKSFFFKVKQYYKLDSFGGEYPRATCWAWTGMPCY